MNPWRIKSQEEIEQELRKLDFEPTPNITDGGRFWKSRVTGQHLHVPDPYDGMYPEIILGDLIDRAKLIGKPQLH